MINGGFQNHLHLMYGLPNGFAVGTVDTSDVLSKGLKRRKREDVQLEEQIAAQLLKARQHDIEIPAKADPIKLGAILREKMYEGVQPDEVQGKERIKRIRLLLLALVMDD